MSPSQQSPTTQGAGFESRPSIGKDCPVSRKSAERATHPRDRAASPSREIIWKFPIKIDFSQYQDSLFVRSARQAREDATTRVKEEPRLPSLPPISTLHEEPRSPPPDAASTLTSAAHEINAHPVVPAPATSQTAKIYSPAANTPLDADAAVIRGSNMVSRTHRRARHQLYAPAAAHEVPRKLSASPRAGIKCFGGCNRVFTRNESREKHWNSHPLCEQHHARVVQGTAGEGNYDKSVTRRAFKGSKKKSSVSSSTALA